jgi:hypothetical protein
MRPSRFNTRARMLAVCAPLAAVAALGLAGVSSASNGDVNCDPATPGWSGACTVQIDDSFQIDEVHPIDGCPARYVGTDATFTGSGEEHLRFVYGGGGFHFHLTANGDERITFWDGSYAVARSAEQFEYQSPDHVTTTLNLTDIFRLQGRIYTADGQPTGEFVNGHGTTHVTWSDTNGNGEPDAGDVVKSDIDNLRITCS